MNIQFNNSLILGIDKKKPSGREWGKLAFDAIKAGLISDIEQLFITEYSHQNYKKYPHQISAAETILRKMQGRGILADEVGLGKTIEAGLVLKELYHQELIKKVLIIVPASLAAQWQYQMFDIFELRFINASWQKSVEKDDIWDFFNSSFKGFTEHDLVISSYERASKAEEEIKKVKWDLIIADEAHRLRNRAYTYQLLKGLIPSYLLLLTATPIHNKLEDFYNLAELVRPNFFGTLPNFKKDFYADASGRKLKNKDNFIAIRNDIMVRQRAVEINLPLPEREVKSLIADASKEEIQFHGAVEEYIRERQRLIREHAVSEQQRWAEQFELMHLGMRANSSPEAIETTLDRKLEKAAILGSEVEKQFRGLLHLAKQIKRPSKTEELLNILKYHMPHDKVLLYTIYEDTQKYLANVLSNNGFKDFLPFGGFMNSKERVATIKSFNTDPKVKILLSTDAGSEGLNLQHSAHVLVNFDLPWNPMRMEQRIGRLHRIGQEHRVLVYNLAVRGSIDEKIVKRLYEKIGLTKHAIGEIEPVITELEDRLEIEKEILELISRARTPDDLEDKRKALEEKLSTINDEIKERELLSNEIFGRFE